MAVHQMPARFDDNEWEALVAWKKRYELQHKTEVSWPDLLLAYANSKVLP